MDIAKHDLSWSLNEASYVLQALVYRGLLKNISCQSLVLNCKCMAVYQTKEIALTKLVVYHLQDDNKWLYLEPSLKLRLATLKLQNDHVDYSRSKIVVVE